MKKRALLVSLIVLLCLCISGCSYLDDLRASRAYIAEDGAIVMSDGTKYLLLPENQYFSPDFSNPTYINIVKDEDVPLLLTSLLGSWGYQSKDGQFLRTDAALSPTYCREDSYASILERINAPFTPELYCYTYHDDEGQVRYTFTPEQTEALEWFLANKEHFTLPAGTTIDYDYRVWLYHYTSDYLFYDKSVDILFADGTFYVKDGDLIYSVPKFLNVTFARAISKSDGANAFY